METGENNRATRNDPGLLENGIGRTKIE